MSLAKQARARRERRPLAERLAASQDRLGRVGCALAPLVNPMLRWRPLRVLLEKLSGIDRRWILPSYQRRPFSRRAGARPRREGPGPSVVLFPTCFVEYSAGETGRAACQVLEHSGVAVETLYPGCCGAPQLHGGDAAGARRQARRLLAGLRPALEAGRAIVVPGPTCSYQLKREVPELSPGPAAEALSRQTFDLCEYLWKLRRESRLPQDFSHRLGRVAYHLPCHLKAQNVGFRGRKLLELAGAEVELLDRCSGVDGSWGMQARWYERSLEVAGPLLDDVRRLAPEHVASDCPLAALRILEGTGRRTVHPVELLRTAYGLGAEG
ncbi:MAG: heterodisulfide reductase-related iron-sulfur binding cluster [Myxococcota bacterium]